MRVEGTLLEGEECPRNVMECPRIQSKYTIAHNQVRVMRTMRRIRAIIMRGTVRRPPSAAHPTVSCRRSPYR